MVNRELEQQRQRQQRERQKCNRSRLAKQQLCTSITLFCTFLSLRRTNTTWEYPIWRFIAGRNIRQQLSFSSPEHWYSSLEFNCKKIANIWRIKRDGISATKFEAARTLFCTFFSCFCRTTTWKCLLLRFMEKFYFSLWASTWSLDLKFTFRRVRLHLKK